MEVREQHAANCSHRNAPQREVLDGFRPDIDDVELAASEDGDAGLGTSCARQRRRRAADGDAERIVRERRRVDSGRPPLGPTLEEPLLHGPQKRAAAAALARPARTMAIQPRRLMNESTSGFLHPVSSRDRRYIR
jgi:hypothetical protein